MKNTFFTGVCLLLMLFFAQTTLAQVQRLTVEGIGVISPDPTATAVVNTTLTVIDTTAEGNGIFALNTSQTPIGGAVGAFGQARVFNGAGTGLFGFGGFAGARGDVLPAGNAGTFYGVIGFADGTGVGQVAGTNTNVGLYGFADGAADNWAIFADGEAFTTGTGVWQTSDASLKQDVQTFEGGLSTVLALRPTSYQFIEDSPVNVTTGRTTLGFIAQELEEVMPEAVRNIRYARPGDVKDTQKADEKETYEYKAVNYTQLIPVTVSAIQEQQELITELQLENELLKKEIAAIKAMLTGKKNMTPTSGNKGFGLEQNQPNPANGITTVQVEVPNDAQSAFLQIVNLEGKVMDRMIVANGKSTVSIDAQQYQNGAYQYYLVINNRVVETKKMIVTQ